MSVVVSEKYKKPLSAGVHKQNRRLGSYSGPKKRDGKGERDPPSALIKEKKG